MAYTAPPAKTELVDTYPNPSNGTRRVGDEKMYDYTTGLLGTTGQPAEARAALGLGVIGNRNVVINGTFSINQRAVAGTVVLTAGQYGLDRWKAGASGCTFTFATTGLDTTVTITAGSLIQVIEASNVVGGSYVMSWSGTAQGKIGGGAYSASGVTATGITGNANLNIEFNAGTVTRAQLEPGTIASPFDRRLAPTEVALCQRYYEGGTARIGGYAGAGSVAFYYQHAFKVPKRAAPTLTYASLSNTNVVTFDARDGAPDSFRWYCVSTAAGGFNWDGTWIASAEL